MRTFTFIAIAVAIAQSLANAAMEFPICTDSGWQDGPVVSGNIVLWEDGDIGGYDLATRTKFTVSSASMGAWDLAISGNMVACTGGRSGLVIYNLKDGSRVEPLDPGGGFWPDKPAISGNMVVWCQWPVPQIMGYDLTTKTKFIVHEYPSTQRGAAISGNTVVWRDNRGGNWNIYGYDMEKKNEFPICTHAASQEGPSVGGNIVIWRDDRNNPGSEVYDIYGYDLTTKTEFPICTNPANQRAAEISGNFVVWADNRNGDWDIYGYDLASKTEFPICTAIRDQFQPDIDGNVVVWRDLRNDFTGREENADIYGTIIPEPSLLPTAMMVCALLRRKRAA